MSIFRSIFTISFYISLSRILGFIRDIIIAQYLGVSALSDAFFAAFRLPNFFRRIFAEGAFNSAFVPIFIEKLQNKKNAKSQEGEELFFVRNIFSLLFYVFLCKLIDSIYKIRLFCLYLKKRLKTLKTSISRGGVFWAAFFFELKKNRVGY